ncbi:epoxide hydrolase family protein [Paraburkholderia atlantica]|uniref:epoxide hydrolase family protein n=1 Tax=Paraburkholderia atlantica TaxID=2654982 RepID=UPI00161DB525|nr:epoxide hydrolase [Paraburkholderia atlantica]MBB5510423.1 microsomal epoxide hydrolase [Paraburkholderia atlantica]
MNDLIKPFQLNVSEQELSELRERLQRVRWPDRETVNDTCQGPQLLKLQALVAHWIEGYEWRRCESMLNDFGQFKTTIDGLDIHFLHIRSPEPDAIPLLMAHGWPGSVLEFRKVIAPLSSPAAHGDDPRQAFHLVIPSMPGFGFSDKPREPGWDILRIGRAYVELMRRLGYDRWAMQGGDLGAGVTDEVASLAFPELIGIHLNFAMFMPTQDEIRDATPDEESMLASARYFWSTLSGYAQVQQNRPQTIGYALADSPVAQAAWIYAMFQDTCGTAGNAEASFTLDEILDDIMLYWIPNTSASSARLYWEMKRSSWSSAARIDRPITVPSGFTMLAGEQVRKSRRWIEQRYSDVRYFAEHKQGGHFAALENPHALVGDIRSTFASLR